jgi:predicted AlkP superfamily pyrophosphatase or phosphodiesterase
MTPERHNLVDNSYFDPEKGEMYTMSKRQLVGDGSWYGGTPIWVQAEKEGMVSASFFFVGSEADIQGIRPTYWYSYDGGIPEMRRVQQALDWLRLPAQVRPHLITMYFSNMDDAGHSYGPNNDAKLREALMRLDTALGKLFNEVDSLGLPIHFIIVSDHGMAEVGPDQFLPIDPLRNDSLYITVNNGALAHFYLRPQAHPDSVFQYLQSQAVHARIYKTQDFPHYRANIDNPRLGDFIALPDFPYYYTDLRSMRFLRRGGAKGEHGFDPAITDLHGIFYAQGPLLKAGLTLPRFQNVHIYPLICQLLGLSVPSGIDGRPEVLAPALR